MTTITFIRHAETDLAGSFCGHTDPPINNAGEAQITALLQRFQPSSNTILYSSDLRRAHTTALRLAHNDASRIITSTALREISFGDWEGLRWPEIEQRDPFFARQWTEQFPLLTPPNAEPYKDFSMRVTACVDHIERTHQYQQVLAVTHAGVMREVLQQRCGLTPQQAWDRTREHCSTFTLACGNEFIRPRSA